MKKNSYLGLLSLPNLDLCPLFRHIKTKEIVKFQLIFQRLFCKHGYLT